MPSVGVRGVSPPEGQRRESGNIPKHNLPAQRTAFVGREPEILEVKRQLAMTRLLTLTGAGGSGRTRLALEVAQDLVGAYPGGVWLVELAPLSEEALVLQTVAKAVKVPEQPGRPLTDALGDALREKRLLLILDNCEHLKEERVQLADVTCRWWVWASGNPPARALLGTPSRASRRRRTLSLHPSGQNRFLSQNLVDLPTDFPHPKLWRLKAECSTSTRQLTCATTSEQSRSPLRWLSAGLA
jgi:hypothetical protein